MALSEKEINKKLKRKISINAKRFEKATSSIEKSQGKNFFAHRSEMDTYGDEGLTFFDSNKASRMVESTGNLFGIR